MPGAAGGCGARARGQPARCGRIRHPRRLKPPKHAEGPPPPAAGIAPPSQPQPSGRAGPVRRGGGPRRGSAEAGGAARRRAGGVAQGGHSVAARDVEAGCRAADSGRRGAAAGFLRSFGDAAAGGAGPPPAGPSARPRGGSRQPAVGGAGERGRGGRRKGRCWCGAQVRAPPAFWGPAAAEATVRPAGLGREAGHRAAARRAGSARLRWEAMALSPGRHLPSLSRRLPVKPKLQVVGQFARLPKR